MQRALLYGARSAFYLPPKLARTTKKKMSLVFCVSHPHLLLTQKHTQMHTLCASILHPDVTGL